MSAKNLKINYKNKNDNQDGYKKQRPVSPHLQIYKWEPSMAYSILHRASAAGVGVIMLFLITMAIFMPYEIAIPELIKNYIIAKLIYIAILLVVGYYIFATIKYMIWGKAKGLDIKTSVWLGHISVICTIIFTIGVYFCGVLS